MVVWVDMDGHQACSLVCTGAGSAGRYDAVALHATVCKPLCQDHTCQRTCAAKGCLFERARGNRLRRHPNVGSLRLLPCPHLQGLPRDMLTEPLCRTDPGLPVSHLRTPRCLPRMWIWRMVAGVRKSLRETMSCFWGVRNLPWTRALGYPRGMTRLGRPEDAPFKGKREKLKIIGGPQGAPWDVFMP